MSELPQSVSEYLSKLLHAEYPAYLRVGDDQRIKERGGSLEHFGLATLNTHTPVTDQLQQLVGLLPHSRALVLPYVQLNEGRYADVHVFGEWDDAWLVFVDSTDEGIEQQGFQQKMLSRSLARENTAAKNPAQNMMAWRVLSQMEIATFQAQPAGGFRIVGEIPPWLQFVDDTLVSDGWCWPSQHPVLEHFLAEAESVWNNPSSRPCRSQIWTETCGDNELYLRMIALRANHHSLILLERLSRTRAETSVNVQHKYERKLFEEGIERL